MSNPSVWTPGSEVPLVNAEDIFVSQAFTATSGQTVFTLTEFSYVPDTTALAVYVSGVMQIPGIDFTETSSSSFTMDEGVQEGYTVLAVGRVA